MKIEVIVKIDGEEWNWFDTGKLIGGTSKMDKEYLAKVVESIEKALEQAKAQLKTTLPIT